jgi:uncharacterized protein (DUF4415 family)
MTVKKRSSRRSLKSDLKRVDAHSIRTKEYEELPELSADRVTEGVVRKAGRPVSSNPRKLITIRLPTDVIDRWRASGPGWQRRMADQLSKVR